MKLTDLKHTAPITASLSCLFSKRSGLGNLDHFLMVQMPVRMQQGKWPERKLISWMKALFTGSVTQK